MPSSFVGVRAELSSRAVSSQVLSPFASLTTVFGMGTGVPSPPLTRTYFLVYKKVSKENFTGASRSCWFSPLYLPCTYGVCRSTADFTGTASRRQAAWKLLLPTFLLEEK